MLPLAVASIAHFSRRSPLTCFGCLRPTTLGSRLWRRALGRLAFALTGGWAALIGSLASRVDVSADDLRRLEALRGADGTLTYLCLDPLTMRRSAYDEALISDDDHTDLCRREVATLADAGHTPLAEGVGWSLT